ncbi:TetR/AcrR family transcriptional regulator [bacterium]|nr:TetR/AcrR family transcriptional regulator [bacterium]MBU1636464.1 TetR/AcrR family transcriptional regulator [bacterium]MBU1921530.1 TetR/AcrR family transcriptional regulator [bacterium]
MKKTKPIEKAIAIDSLPLSVRESILIAATEIFSEQGKNGARIDHIAARANVNKALVYYYFHNKDTLFAEAGKRQIQAVFSEIQTAMSNEPLEELDAVAFLKRFIRHHFLIIRGHRTSIRLLIGALADDPEMVRRLIREVADDGAVNLPKMIIRRIEEGIAAGQLRAVNPKQMLISILGMNLFFFIARPIAQVFLDLKVEDEELFLEERMTSVLDLLLYGAVERRTE